MSNYKKCLKCGEDKVLKMNVVAPEYWYEWVSFQCWGCGAYFKMWNSFDECLNSVIKGKEMQ